MNNRYSFTDLFTREIDLDRNKKVIISQIMIPQIQRPYAQGRLDDVCTYIRKTFLDELFICLQGEETFDLNFIYGVIKPSNNGYRLELLDGQQRLTTLFLLHWYIINRELNKGNLQDTEIRTHLEKFVYETRSTSSVFCNKLSWFYVDLSDKNPSDAIRNSKWYFKSFDRDSTICAMLTMLDAIHDHYEESPNKNLHTKLNNLQFYIKSLGLFNLSEELYIKMNARGLQLSPFENFKADLNNFVSNYKYSGFEQYVPLYKKGTSEKVHFSLNFSIKLDAKWVDIFWKRGANDFDEAYMSFFSRFFACKYIVDSKEDVSDKDMRSDETIKILYTDAERQTGQRNYLGFRTFDTLLKRHPEYIVTLDKVLDTFYEFDYSKSQKIIYRQMVPIWDKDKNDTDCGDDFYCNTGSKISHIKLVVLAAVIEFIDAFPSFKEDLFNDWMRFVWNVTENTNIDGLTPASSLIRKFSKIARFVADKVAVGQPYYDALSQWKDSGINEHENRAVIEEVEKAKRIAEDNDWLSLFKDIEQHPFFKGMVLFFYQKGMSKTDYAKNAENAKLMFDREGITSIYREKHILIRAISSCFNDWRILSEKYITERVETHKYLKNILAADENVRAMLSHAVSYDSEVAIKQCLQSYIDTPKEIIPWENAQENDKLHIQMAFDRLRKDVMLYDWIAKVEAEKNKCFRVYWFDGLIMFAIPYTQYYRVALDTERAKMAGQLNIDFGFEFIDPNQKAMYEQYDDCFDKEVELHKEISGGYSISVKFASRHQLYIQVKCGTIDLAKELKNQIPDSQLSNDNHIVEMPILEHSTFEKSYRKLSSSIQTILTLLQGIGKSLYNSRK